ncbi:MAG: FAD-dependent oxidoreductase [Candidatus Dormibacteraeota bacterium]|nr:FAD-dependent oxidoreductase [Candidatus Dormibacteraeota bacterium]
MSGSNGTRGRSLAPSAYPPPVNQLEEFIGPPTDPAGERIEVGVVIVGGGPAGLACAIRLLQLLGDDPELSGQLGEVPVAVVEKGKTCGAHNLSGAIMRPSAMEQLFGDLPKDQWPTYGPVPGEAVYLMLDSRRSLHIPTPPPFRNHGNYVISVSELSRWLAEKAEQAGAYILTETSAARLLVEEGTVKGVRSGDKGRGREGEQKANFEPGSDLVARATVLAEGAWGHLTSAAVQQFGLQGADPQVWDLGVKEVWEVPRPLTKVIHTLGWPMRTSARYREFGGSWIYPMGPDKVSIGFVAGLDYTDATMSVHDVLQLFKTHPRIHQILDGGKRISWGAKAIPEGGWWALPKLAAPGMVICGDAAGMVNVPELKGVHYAMHSGILAAEEIYRRLKEGSTDFSAYDQAVRGSVIGRDLYRTRNMRQPFARGFFAGGLITNLMIATGGRFPGGHWHTHSDADSPMFDGGKSRQYPRPDGAYTFDKLSSVYLTGNATRDDAPNHIRVRRQVPREVAEAWAWMCPAGVYEIPEGSEGSDTVDVVVNHTNCIQCGAIMAKGGRLTPPEGGDGPTYTNT